MRIHKIWVIAGAILVAAVLCGVTALLANTLELPAQASQAESTNQTSMTLIPAATPTPPGMNSMFFTPTPTYAGPMPGSPIGIAAGVYVQISGTDGEGLRLRVSPGTSSEVRFLALDAEVFKVVDGPRNADEYTWWYLEAPYDQSRSGWAAANFLSVVELEPQTEATP